jgi:hypothetical protein
VKGNDDVAIVCVCWLAMTSARKMFLFLFVDVYSILVTSSDEQLQEGGRAQVTGTNDVDLDSSGIEYHTRSVIKNNAVAALNSRY